MSVILFSALEESYMEHIKRCTEKFNFLFPIFYSSTLRLLNLDSEKWCFELLKGYFSKMISFHDLGKLTKKWQDNIGTKRKLPSHAAIGAAYLWKILPDGIKEPITFAVAIHHTDKGLLGDNIEKPDVQAILDGIVDFKGNIYWHNEVENLENSHFSEEVRSINVDLLKSMARGLRVWAKGCGLLEQHERRLQASLVHHILKLCDISAATEREDYKKQDNQDYYGGWLMVENIRNYVEAINKRI